MNPILRLSSAVLLSVTATVAFATDRTCTEMVPCSGPWNTSAGVHGHVHGGMNVPRVDPTRVSYDGAAEGRKTPEEVVSWQKGELDSRSEIGRGGMNSGGGMHQYAHASNPDYGYTDVRGGGHFRMAQSGTGVLNSMRVETYGDAIIRPAAGLVASYAKGSIDANMSMNSGSGSFDASTFAHSRAGLR